MPADQAFVEGGLLTARDWGRGWQSVEMLNNAERLDPYGEDDDSVALRAARSARVLTALDEGSAWRRRREGVLAVLRLEVFASADDGSHRAAWTDHGTACLDAVWRERWRERDRLPGWIEARWRVPDDAAAPDPMPAVLGGVVDWIVVEDQTGVNDTGTVLQYEHLTIWSGRALATLTVRHDQVHDLDDQVVQAAATLHDRLAGLDG